MRACTSEPTSPQVDIARGRKGVGSGERAPIVVFLLLDCVGEVFSYMACCIPQIGAGARVDDGNVEYKRLILELRVVIEECPRSRFMSIRNGFSLPFCLLALLRKGHISSRTNCALLSRRDRASTWWRT